MLFFNRKIKQYIIPDPPFIKQYHMLTPLEAEENYKWFINIIPDRLKRFFSIYLGKTVDDVDEIDFSPENLVVVWEWFVKKSKHKNEKFSPETEAIIRDIGVYLGEVFVRNNPSLSWDLHKEKNVNMNKPVISGFKDGDFYPVVDPLSATRGIALSILSNQSDKYDLYRCYVKWLGMTPDHSVLSLIPPEKDVKKRSSVVIVINGEEIPLNSSNTLKFKGELTNISFETGKAKVRFKNESETVEAICSERLGKTLKLGERYSITICDGYIVGLTF